jgi:hypothetical protein
VIFLLLIKVELCLDRHEMIFQFIMHMDDSVWQHYIVCACKVVTYLSLFDSRI